MENVHVFCFFASYVVALALDGLRLLRGSALLRALGLGFGVAGLLAQSIYLVARSNATDLPPLLSSGHDWLLVLAWTAVVFYLFLSFVLWSIKRDVPMGLFILPAVLILIGASDLGGKRDQSGPLGRDRRWLRTTPSRRPCGTGACCMPRFWSSESPASSSVLFSA